MTSSPILDPITSWQTFLESHPQAHILQTAAWGALKSNYGWSRHFVRSADGGAMILVRRFPFGLKLAYIPKGPIGKWSAALVDLLDAACHEIGAFALKAEPDAVDSEELATTLTDLGFHRSPQTIQPRRTLVIDISDKEDEILGRMHQKTRYNIRLSDRKDVEVRPWNDLAAFGRMMHRTADRQDFGVHTTPYYQQAYDLFHPRGECEIFVAEYQGDPLASLMVFGRGDRAWYLYGASTPKERNRMPTYALQWAAIRWAKSRGCNRYDLWGVPDASEQELEEKFTDRHDGLWGVYRFKRGFGGKLVRFAGAWDRVYQPAVYRAYRLFARVRMGD
ncbi:MAG: peptidoglycan bridge formation glycyltransferase FemA/FemB family protein [Anaerolineales bacterium]